MATEFFSGEGTLVEHLGEQNMHQQGHGQCLLGNEATWHSWLGLSDATSWLGIAVAQISRVSKAVRPENYHVLHHAACICQATSVVILLIGTYRFFREQSAINGTGKRVSQWSLLAIGSLVFIVSRGNGSYVYATATLTSCSLYAASSPCSSLQTPILYNSQQSNKTSCTVSHCMRWRTRPDSPSRNGAGAE